VPGSFREGRPLHRGWGPEDPEAYVAQLATDAAETGCTVDPRVVYDPIGVRDRVVQFVDRTTALLVLGTHRRARPMRALRGSHAARVVHDVEVPALVVPLVSGG
jgi:nucleotide-binding universal stress UspA family protein